MLECVAMRQEMREVSIPQFWDCTWRPDQRLERHLPGPVSSGMPAPRAMACRRKPDRGDGARDVGPDARCNPKTAVSILHAFLGALRRTRASHQKKPCGGSGSNDRRAASRVMLWE